MAVFKRTDEQIRALRAARRPLEQVAPHIGHRHYQSIHANKFVDNFSRHQPVPESTIKAVAPLVASFLAEKGKDYAKAFNLFIARMTAYNQAATNWNKRPEIFEA